MRKLATIQRISAIRPIDGADRIVVADVLGWSVVVGKDEFMAGDLAVYFEIDSWCDSSISAFQTDVFKPRYSNWNGKTGMRLKTIKLRKQISQGLLMPISAFPEFYAKDNSGRLAHTTDLSEGTDVTEILKIEKWEAAEEAKGNGVPGKQAGGGAFPSFIRKTDQERVQNYVNELPKHLDETFEVTIKLDGSSMTVYGISDGSPLYAHALEDIDARVLRKLGRWGKLWFKLKRKLGWLDRPEVLTGVCSRNVELGDDGNHFYAYVKKHGMLEAIENFCTEQGAAIAVQGELIAPSIQQNHEQVKDFEFYVYDVFDINAQEYTLPVDSRGIVERLGFKYVPVVMEDFSMAGLFVEVDGRVVNSYAMPSMDNPRAVVERLLEVAEGPGMNPGVKREGLVYKSNSTPFSFKAISNSYLLKKEGK